jgi:membrane protein implicated in regulation of membrane protease activity
MSWSDIYLVCFLVGFSLCVISALGGFFHLHIPGLHHGHGFHHGHAGGGWHSAFNFGSMAAFLTWFGGVGYLVSNYSGLFFWAAFFVSIAGGLVGGAIVFLFLSKVLLANERPLDPMDYEMVGVYGRLTSPIREGGTGEISFSQEGVRRGSAARSDDGSPIHKDTDVIVMRYENGIAYVRRWDDLSDKKEKL